MYGNYFKSRQICLNICDPNIHIDMVINNLLTKCYNDIWSDTGTMTCLVIYRCYDIYGQIPVLWPACSGTDGMICNVYSCAIYWNAN